MPLIDITPPLSPDTPIWPGDTPFSVERTWTIGDETPVNVSKITLSTHTGAHADAPLHYNNTGAPIDTVSLDAYVGPCVVLHLIGEKSISAALLRDAMDRVTNSAPPQRVLIRTYERQPETAWDSDFAPISTDAVHWLADAGALLVGVDTPSLDAEQSKTMDAHHAVYARDMRILEGLRLDDVTEGHYELIALPLKLQGLDAAPVRAVLRKLA